MKKYLHFFFVAVLMATAYVFTACSEDDDSTTTSLAGTTWKIIADKSEASEDEVYEDEESDGIVNSTIKFNKNGTLTFKPDQGWNYAKWKLVGNELTLTLGEGNVADDCMVGNLTIEGKNATYRYYWKDANDEWVDDKTYYNMTLIKQ